MPRLPTNFVAPIGSEFALADEDITLKRNEHRTFIPKSRTTYWVASGRDALLAFVKGYRLTSSDELLLPSYICTEVIQTLRKHVHVSFYPVKSDLSVAIRSIESCMTPATRAMLLVHYFGFPHPQLQALSRFCKNRGVALIEDCVQAAFTKVGGKAIGDVGDLAFCSFRKFLPIPDGGWLVVQTPVSIRLQDSPAHRVYVQLRDSVLRMKAISLQDQVPKRVRDFFFKESFVLVEDGFGYPKPAPMEKASLDLLKRFPLYAWARQRRKNYQQLLLLLPRRIKPLFERLPAGVVPLGLPVLSRRRDALQRDLAAERIYAPVHWRLGSVPEEYEDAWELSHQLLTLPIDQRYGSLEMKRIATALCRYA